MLNRVRAALTAAFVATLLTASPVVLAQGTNADGVVEYFITVDPGDFANIYQNYSEDIWVPITLTFNGKTWTSCEMRIRGDSTREFPKKSLKVRFNGEPWVTGRDRINLNAEYQDKTYMHSVIASRLMRESGQPAARASHARVYINGTFNGLYVEIENIDDGFLEANGLDTNGNLFKATRDQASMNLLEDFEGLWERKTRRNESFDVLRNFVQDLNTIPESQFYNWIKEKLEYNAVINIVAMNILISNGSTYYHNYYMYHDRVTTNKWRMIPWDMDKILQQQGITYDYARSSNPYNPDNALPERLLANPQSFQDVRNRINQLTSTVFSDGFVAGIIDSMKARIESSVLEDTGDNIPDLALWNQVVAPDRVYAGLRKIEVNRQMDERPRPFLLHRVTDPYVGDVTLEWDAATMPNGGTVTYNVRWTNEGGFLHQYDDPIVKPRHWEISGITGTSVTIPNLAPDRYFWQVRADGSNGEVMAGFGERSHLFVAAGTSIPATVSSSATWTASGSPYVASGDVTIASGTTITVSPGTSIRLPQGKKLIINGTMTALGTNDDPIFIKSDISANSFNCIEVGSGGKLTLLDAVVSDGNVSGSCKAAVSVYGTADLEDIKFVDNKASVYVEGTATITDSDFDSSNNGHAIVASGADLTVYKNRFRDVSGGNAIRLEGSGGTIEDNTFHDGSSEQVYVTGGSNGVKILDNKFEDGTKGVRVNNSGSVTIVDNEFTRNNTGVEVDGAGVIMLDRNTFHKNTTGLKGASGSQGVAKNNIYSDSGSKSVDLSGSNITVSYSISNKEALSGSGNKQVEPAFVDESRDDFHLQVTSPAVDMGDPSDTDPDGTRADMGAHYLDQSAASNVVINEISYNPSSSFNSGDWVELHNPTSSSKNVGGWKFKDEDPTHSWTIPSGTTIPANGYLVIAQDGARFTNVYSGVSNYKGSFGFGLSGGGELVQLFDSNNMLVDEVDYNDRAPWPIEADGLGKTIELVDVSLDNENATNWKDSDPNGGTPGKLNSATVSLDDEDIPNLADLEVDENYPNPFSAKTTMAYRLGKSAEVGIEVVNLLGQVVSRIEAGPKAPGSHTVGWDASDAPSGVYFVRFAIDGEVALSRKLMVIR